MTTEATVWRNYRAGKVGVSFGRDASRRLLDPEEARALATKTERRLDDSEAEDSVMVRSFIAELRDAADDVE